MNGDDFIKIRTITYNLPDILDDISLNRIAQCSSMWKNSSLYIRTQRINMALQKNNVSEEELSILQGFSKEQDIRWFNIPIDTWEFKNFEPELPAKFLEKYPNAFCNLQCAKEGMIKEEVLKNVAKSFFEVAQLNKSGEDNFRFGATMNVLPDGPFFPFTYSSGNDLSFSIGLEFAEVINRLLDKAEEVKLTEIRQIIIDNLELQVEIIKNIAEDIADVSRIMFRGIDFSLAPLPQRGSSVISILEKLGVLDINQTGILFATGFLTDILKELHRKYHGVGFSGVMYSLLEDYKYAAMNDMSSISVDKMIALSTMCGCGVDMVPIPMNTPFEAIRTVLLDVACVSSRLNKPLGVRLLPIGDTEGNRTAIKSSADFIINTKIVDIHANHMVHFSDDYKFNRLI